MIAKVINYGHPNYFPTCVGNVWLPRGQEREIENRKLAKELSAYPMVDVTVVEGSLDGPDIDYSKYSIQQLRHMASQSGIKGTFSMTKKSLITKFLEVKKHE